MTQPQIAILGAGAIGCYLGAALTAAGLPTTLLLRERFKQELEQAGQLLLSDYRQLQLPVALPILSTDASTLAQADIIIVTVKCLAVTEAAAQIRQHARPGTLILALQNGIGSEQAFIEQCPQQILVRGIVGFNVAPLGNGRFHCGTEGAIYCEDSLPNAIATQLAQAFAAANIAFHTHADFDALRWAKLQLNLNNAINALSNQPLKTELEQRDYRRVLSMAMSELLALAKAKKLILPKLTRLKPQLIPLLLNVPDFLFKKLAASMLAIDPQARSSMWEDLANQRLTEVDFLNGAVAAEAQRLGLAAPVNAKLAELIHQREGQPLAGLKASELLKQTQA